MGALKTKQAVRIWKAGAAAAIYVRNDTTEKVGDVKKLGLDKAGNVRGRYRCGGLERGESTKSLFLKVRKTLRTSSTTSATACQEKTARPSDDRKSCFPQVLFMVQCR